MREITADIETTVSHNIEENYCLLGTLHRNTSKIAFAFLLSGNIPQSNTKGLINLRSLPYQPSPIIYSHKTVNTSES